MMSAKAYMRWSLAIIAGLALFPTAVYALVKILLPDGSCVETSDLCGLIGLFAGFVFVPLTVIAATVALVVMTERRIGTLLPTAWIVVPGALMLSAGFYIADFGPMLIESAFDMRGMPRIPFSLLPLLVVLALFSREFERSDRFSGGYFIVDNVYGYIILATSALLCVVSVAQFASSGGGIYPGIAKSIMWTHCVIGALLIVHLRSRST